MLSRSFLRSQELEQRACTYRGQCRGPIGQTEERREQAKPSRGLSAGHQGQAGDDGNSVGVLAARLFPVTKAIDVLGNQVLQPSFPVS
jgi:hypothetical protein